MFKQHDFSQSPMEKSDLRKLKQEVLDRGSDATLPCNLPDAWLNLLARDLEMFLQKRVEDHSYLTAPLAIVSHLLLAKHGNKGKEVSFSEKELFIYLHDLQIEIALEMIRRNNGIAPEPASLDTIFTNREVTS